MKKSAIIIITIAILGLLGIYEKTQANTHQLVSPSQTSAASSSNMAQNMSSKSAVSSGSGSSMMVAKYKNGAYTGDSEFTPYGTVQISVVVSGGKITNVNFLQMPSDQEQSQMRTQYSEPLLKQTTLNKQSANIDFVSGATDTSYAFQQSLQAALNHAVNS